MKKICEKIAFMAGLMALITTLVTPMVSADGMFISDEEMHLYEPYQKAVIYWNGFTETMILSSAVRTDNFTDIAWIVPIISTTMPNVTAGNISIFRDLVDYFKKSDYWHYYDWMRDVITENGKNVTVFESKEIDIYDVVILKATNASDLIDWLIENNFKVSEEAHPLIDRYVNMSNCYFVINKIDLKNRFQKILEEIENGTVSYSSSEYREYQDVLEALRQGMATPLKFTFTPTVPYYPLSISSLSAGYGIIEVYVIGEHPVTDKNNMLQVEECKGVNLSLIEKLSQYFSVEKADFVTRLSFHGILKDLVDDAEFILYPLSKPEQTIFMYVKSNLENLTAETQITGVAWDPEGDVLEVQYRIDNEVEWRLADGTTYWSFMLNTTNLADGNHTLYLRALRRNGATPIYSEEYSFTFSTHNVKDEVKQQSQQNIDATAIILTGLVVLSIAAVAVISRKTALHR